MPRYRIAEENRLTGRWSYAHPSRRETAELDLAVIEDVVAKAGWQRQPDGSWRNPATDGCYRWTIEEVTP